MRRGTTPTVTLTVQGVELTNTKEIIITFYQSDHRQWNKHKNDAGVTVQDNIVKVKLTQDETLAMGEGTLKVQMRGLTTNGEAFATDVATLMVEDVLSDGVIA